jgi:hypothetical protein
MAGNEHNQKAGQRHAEGQHGEKTHEAFLENLQRRDDAGAEADDAAERGSPYGANESDGRHRLSEEREQHDEAEKNSELRKTNGSDPAR